MAAPSSSDTSSEDEESTAKFREAVIDTPSVFQKDTTYIDNEIKIKKEVKPSKRPDKEQIDYDDEQIGHIVNTTPGIRKHISKKLTEVIDSNLQYSEKSCVDTVTTEEPENVVKLFSNSSKFLLEKNSSVSEDTKPVKRRPVSSSSDSSSEDERLAEASVSHDFIIQQKDQPYLATRKPPDIIIKSSTSDEQLTGNDKITHFEKTKFISKKSDNDDSAIINNKPDIDSAIDDKLETHTKKSKKKRKKQKKEKKDT